MIFQEYESSNQEVARTYLNREDGVLFEESIKDFSNCPETWKGFQPFDVLDYALPISGKMSAEIGKLRKEVAQMKRENSRLRTQNLELSNENRRVSNLKKTLYRFFLKIWRKIIN